MKVLLVDNDDTTFQELYGQVGDYFHSFQIAFASYDSDILDIIEEEDISIVLLKILFSDDRGVSILKQIRSEKRFGNVYINILLPSEQIQHISTYFELGADDCILNLDNLRYFHARLMVAKNNILNKKATHAAFQAYTDLKNMQGQLVQSEKLAGIGRLAAGVAHEINNPLGFVSGNVEALEKYIERYHMILEKVNGIWNLSAEECKNLCSEISTIWKKKKLTHIMEDMESLFSDTEEGINRISVIVTSLKNFSRINQQEEWGFFDLNDGIQMTLVVAKNELKYDCDVDFQPSEIPVVYANGGQINQVILNMLINAAYAIKEKFAGQKGLIQIRTYQKEDPDVVYFSIEDNGCGMSEETVSHVFEPFFTTKPVGVGTGLGLGIVYDIIYNKHQGKINITSKEGEGTKFEVALPIHEQEEIGE